MKTALIVIDVQIDFLPGGALAVPEGDLILPVIRKLLTPGRYDVMVATQDWHPENHASFAASHPGKNVGDMITLHGLPQVLWPVHCVQHSFGAELAPEIDTTQFDRIFTKGTDPEIDSYSGFFDNGHRRSTGLGEYLKQQGVTDVHVAGLATDYCVKFTALDGIAEGFSVYLIENACRGVNLKTSDVEAAVREMRDRGVRIIQEKDE